MSATGAGIVPAEMFPLREREKGNPAESFRSAQLRAPRNGPALLSMLCREIPERAGKNAKVTHRVHLRWHCGLPPPPDSWATQDMTAIGHPHWRGGELRCPRNHATRFALLFLRTEARGRTAGIREACRRILVVLGGEGSAHRRRCQYALQRGRSVNRPRWPFVMNTKGIHAYLKDYERTNSVLAMAQQGLCTPARSVLHAC